MTGRVRWTSGTAVVALLALAMPAWAALDGYSMKQWGGTYLADCQNPSGPKVTVFENDIVFLHGSNRVAGSKLEASASFFGNSPPEDYVEALMSETPDAQQLLAIVYQDAAGEFIKLDGDAKVMAQIGKAAAAFKYRRCDAMKAAAPSTPAPAAASKHESSNASDMLGLPKFKAAYFKAPGPKTKVDWLTHLDGPGPNNRKVKVAGAEYVLLGACKTHDYGDHNVTLLYSSARGVVYGKIYEAGKKTLIGGPSPGVAKELERLWVAEWRQIQ